HAHGNQKAGVLAAALDKATEKLLNEGKSPSRKVGEIDNRGSHFFLATYWAEELAQQTEDAALSATFQSLAQELSSAAEEIAQGLLDVQGSPADLGGYYWVDDAKTTQVMRPVAKFNAIIDGLK
ncbi:MAG: NADP-dependent isocitrate dehydrogenase, partial [Corynebacterium flavescens]|nr:NADP-dependent isocitrate dehydrogenase [Corynebacterium flavescens]